MPVRVIRFWLLASLPLLAQTPKITDYAARNKVAGVEIGARYLPQGLPSSAGVHAGKNFLVVDVGIFPDFKSGLTISKSQFTVIVDGKSSLAAQSPVAASPGGSSLADAREPASNDGAVQLGGPPVPTPHGSKTQELESSMPRHPISLDEPAPSSSLAPARKAALPEGLITKPVSGYLFFRFGGDPKSVHSLELNYQGAGGAQIKIRIL